jgi:hypothetical protein
LMHFDVARHAQELAVVRIVTPCLHTVWAVNRLGSLNGQDVVTVHARRQPSFCLASLAQSFGSAPYNDFHLLP